MKQQLYRALVAAAATLFVPAVIGMPVHAESGSGSSGSSDSTVTASDPGGSSSDDQKSTTTTTKSTDTEAETEAEKAHIEDLTKTNVSQLKNKGKDVLETAKKDSSTTRTAEDRTKSCEAHKQGLEQKVSSIKTNSQKHLTKINDVLGKITASQTDTSGIANYSDLVAAANTAKTTATASVDALNTLAPTVDCNSTSVASDVATFKAAAAQARTDLKAYRDAVKAVLKAIETQKETSTGGDQ